MSENDDKNCLDIVQRLIGVGVALSTETDHSRLLKLILGEAMKLANADAGTLYLVYKQTRLSFAVFANETLHMKPTDSIESGFPITSVPLFINGSPNLKNVASYCYHMNQTVFISDAYESTSFDFSRMQDIDRKVGYESHSFLTVPLRDEQKNVIGILQLINAHDKTTNNIIPFTSEIASIIESLASQAAVTLIKHELIQSQRKIFHSLLQLIANAIDSKSKHTSNHCVRVPILTILIADAVNHSNPNDSGMIPLSKNQYDELIIAAWLHDCGKLIIPEYIINKSTKLEAIYDRIEVINERFEIIRRDITIQYQKQLQAPAIRIAISLEKNTNRPSRIWMRKKNSFSPLIREENSSQKRTSCA